MRIRVKFSKHGLMKYIGHLDVMRAFQKMNRRAEIPIAYTEGFSPHQKLSFAQPLSVGVESDGEYADMELKEEADTDALIQRLNKVAPEGIRVSEISVLTKDEKNAMASVRSASYNVSFRGNHAPRGFDAEGAVRAFEAAETLTVLKTTKKGTKEVDLKRGIRELRAEGETLFMKLDAGSENNLKPGQVMDALFDLTGVSRPSPFELIIKRLELYGEDDRPLGSP